MIEKSICLDSIEQVKAFVNIAMSKEYDIELLSGRYVINAKSIMGIFSLDLTKPLKMAAHCEEDDPISNQITPFLCEDKKQL